MIYFIYSVIGGSNLAIILPIAIVALAVLAAVVVQDLIRSMLDSYYQKQCDKRKINPEKWGLYANDFSEDSIQ